ncbi:hormogonium polysaccharide biosynthesis protein HpsA [Nodosilinea sp. PGN35]|uniref:hormogonium polysaccharide biosynthesis protein HpsA n=1 Tax=Nodosilinea sp. PGN35 TaxID=3020489 RepID=UPI0023B32654|nr:hormogonium polysaccharide biosynthesis protein HpsA [Nodosilinea sp. TSF1-S3]MDF0370174.1 hormogonium polysaccharide biosynthesis protein HpsA [Nodosilinea sp. TSF1-S3]
MSRHLLRKALRLPQAALKRLVNELLQLVLLANRPARLARSGFVLPTTVLLVLMVVLTATALTYRSFTRSDMAISQREQQVISNAATPALDRARAKIEFVFNKDTRLPSGLPTSDFLTNMMLATSYLPEVVPLPNDPFTLPDETRLDINRDNVLDNAWSFVSPANGETIVYSILADDQGPGTADTIVVQSPVNQAKANALVTRTGPLATTEATSNCSNARSEAGWQVVNNGDSATLQKNFQINVFVPNANSANRTVESFELQQSRIANRGNKWAAWFRYDMEIFAGPVFNINGAMHTDGNLIVNGGNSNGSFTSYMISSHNSCVYGRESSEITVADTITTPSGTFQGQIIKGDMGKNVYGGNSATFHTWVNDNVAPRTDRTLGTNNDSVDGGVPGDVATNPIILFGLDRHVHTNSSTWTRDAAWDNNPIRTERRILNKRVAKPFVDDFSRADNRWGPKPRYSDNNTALDLTLNGQTVGSRIAGNLDQLTDPVEGLDGYWERQAIEYGLRLVVGERLELGNPSGWNYNPATNAVDTTLQDRLYPPNATPSVGTKIRANEYRQKRTLRDNLAAVQSMVVYHYDHPNGGNYPAACMAMTAHPGTQQTIRNSRTFAPLTTGSTIINTNFLNGTGTNGYEFDFYSEASFGSAVADPTSNLGKALRNLARFAGDPRGGAPFFPPVQEAGIVHPFPYMAMWGDFSPLRRIFDDYLDAATGAVTYANLSQADRATLHSAACTLGMLSYNLQFASNQAAIVGGTNSWSNRLLGKNNQGQIMTEIGKPIWDAFGAGNSGPVAGSLAAGCVQNPLNANEYDCTNVRPTKEQMIALAGFTANQIRFVDLIADLTQIERDRTYGFQQSPETEDPALGVYRVQQGSRDYLFRFPDNCHPNNTSGYLAPLFNAATGAAGVTDERAGVALVCATRPKYPSLFYLFPKTAHGQRDGQPLTEEFINPARTGYILNAAGTAGINFGVTYQPVEPSTIALAPRLLVNWQTPAPTSPGVAFNPQANHIIGGLGATRGVAFLDKGMFDGREQMGIRVLDMDLQMLTTTTVRGGTDYWISDVACDPDTQDCDVFTEGIVYAYREDAVREEEIVRPRRAGQTIDDCLTVANVISANCRMITTPGSEQDPPLSPALISLKPVDFFGDPDRRPYGFRLLNGVDMSRGRARDVGMTFVTDNSVYVLGDFNLHSTAGTVATIIEEFKSKIGGIDWNPANFYNNRVEDPANANGIDVRFSQPDTDTWRPVEILADSFNILSANFLDGAAEDTFTQARPGAYASTTTSYMNQSRPNAAQNVVRDVNPPASASTAAASPVWINRNSTAFIGTTPINTAVGSNDWTGLGDNEETARRRNARLVEAGTTAYVNAVVIAGIVPSRPQQSYGGLHNFPRLNESWSEGSNNRNLQIAGAFFQLNFSTAATGPFEHDSWEPGVTYSAGDIEKEQLGYYRPPARRWGYDPGLLYYPPAAAARRFVSVDTPRSEYFRELASDDPYIVNLRCARTGGAFVFTDPTVRGTCPA